MATVSELRNDGEGKRGVGGFGEVGPVLILLGDTGILALLAAHDGFVCCVVFQLNRGW